VENADPLTTSLETELMALFHAFRILGDEMDRLRKKSQFKLFLEKKRVFFTDNIEVLKWFYDFDYKLQDMKTMMLPDPFDIDILQHYIKLFDSILNGNFLYGDNEDPDPLYRKQHFNRNRLNFYLCYVRRDIVDGNREADLLSKFGRNLAWSEKLDPEFNSIAPARFEYKNGWTHNPDSDLWKKDRNGRSEPYISDINPSIHLRTVSLKHFLWKMGNVIFSGRFDQDERYDQAIDVWEDTFVQESL